MDNPGAIYDVPHRLDRPDQPKYSFGSPPSTVGRKIEAVTSTPITIGPTSYFRRGYPDSYVSKSQPKYSIPRSLYGKELASSKFAVNETYEN